MLYKLPFLRKLSLARYSFLDLIAAKMLKLKLGEKKHQLLRMGSEVELNRWTLLTDRIFNGTSKCSLERTEDNTVIFSGRLAEVSNGEETVQSFTRAWIIYQFFTQDMSDFVGVKIKYRISSIKDVRNFQFQVLTKNFIGDTFFFATFVDRKSEDSFGEWKQVNIPFDVLRLNSFGSENRALWGDRVSSLEYVEAIGIGVSDFYAGDFRIEISSIEAYSDPDDDSQGWEPIKVKYLEANRSDDVHDSQDVNQKKQKQKTYFE
ncbi:endoribonuclease [Acrasis kona]|uniref:Endoribonuclease n=1 Tax=Acrasis kona TaxID=1008807 RepID=A0AAW2Z131_9EUKA